MYVPKDTKLRTEIIKLHHDSPVVGHPSQWKTLELISRNYWWLGITQKVNNYVSRCNKCQRMKSFPEKPAGKLKPNESTIAPWKDITLPKPEFFHVRTLHQGHLLIEGEEEKLLSRIRSSKDHCYKSTFQHSIFDLI